jgi:outer membrane protein
MKKIILTAAAIFAFGFAHAQSNKKGTIHVNVLGGFSVGSATSQGDAAGSDKYKFSANGSNFGAQFQYGLADNFSAGIGLETGTTILTPKDNGVFLVNPSLSLFKVNLSGRYYLLNEEKLNIYAGPSIGYTSGKDKTVYSPYDNTSTKFSGLNYGINAGGNYFFSDTVGINLNLGYEANSLKGTTTQAGYPDQTGKVSIGGLKIMAGLALKF